MKIEKCYCGHPEKSHGETEDYYNACKHCVCTYYVEDIEAHNQKEELDEVLLVDNSNTEPKKNWTYKELTEQVILKERARIKKEILEMPWHEDYTSGLREIYLKIDDILKLL